MYRNFSHLVKPGNIHKHLWYTHQNSLPRIVKDILIIFKIFTNKYVPDTSCYNSAWEGIEYLK